MAVVRISRLGSEDSVTKQRVQYITSMLGGVVGQKFKFEEETLHVTGQNYISIVKPSGDFTVSIYQFMETLRGQRLERFLTVVVEASEDAAPISLDEFKLRNGIGTSVVKSLERKKRNPIGDWVPIDPGEVVPF